MSMEENVMLSWLSFGEDSEETSNLVVQLSSSASWFLKILKTIDFEAGCEDPCRVLVKIALQDRILGGSIVMMIPRTCRDAQSVIFLKSNNYFIKE